MNKKKEKQGGGGHQKKEEMRERGDWKGGTTSHPENTNQHGSVGRDRGGGIARDHGRGRRNVDHGLMEGKHCVKLEELEKKKAKKKNTVRGREASRLMSEIKKKNNKNNRL